MFIFHNVKKKNTTKTHAYILVLYFETYGFKYDERIASIDVMACSDGSWHITTPKQKLVGLGS